MNKEKDSAGVSQANVPGVPQNASGVPVKRLRSSRRWIVIICIIVVVAVAAGVVVVTVTSPENIMRSYLRSKYGKDFVLVGELRRRRECNSRECNSRECSSVLQEHYYESEAHPVDNYGLRFRVVLDNGKMSDTYIEAGRVLAEEDRLRPYIERIFSKNTDIKVEFQLCEQGEASMKGFSGLLRAMKICKKATEDMTLGQVIDSNELRHEYNLYIYALDGQPIKTDDDKLRLIEKLRKITKYLPEGRPDCVQFAYYTRTKEPSEGSELWAISASDLSSTEKLTRRKIVTYESEREGYH